MRRSPLAWLVVFALLAAGFGATVLALNSDVFSAHGFVRSYLQALARQDADEALAFSGVTVPESQGAALLVDGALGGLDDIQLLSDVADGNGRVVRFAYVLDGDEQVTEFHVEPDGTTLGLFQRWRFAVTPLARLDVTVTTDSRFTVNGEDAAVGAPLLVLVPGAYVVDRDTELLAATSATVLATEVGATTQATIDPQPTAAFEVAAEDAVAGFLDDCATQQVLMPTGCPFGFTEANRVEGLPEWSIAAHPTVTLEAGDSPGTWRALGAEGEAHIRLTVKSLFDGSTSVVDDDVPFSGSYLLAVGADDTITVLEAAS